MAPDLQRAATLAARRARTTLRGDVDRLRLDAGWSVEQLAHASGLDPSYLRRVLAGTANPVLETYARLPAALGADLATRLYPNTGPSIHDRHQAPMLELLLDVLHPRWHPFGEVAVRRPSRGWIDVALHDARARLLVAAELQSGLHRVEQLIRWQGEKAASLPSWEGWLHLGEPEISRLLLVRRTRATREAARAAANQLRLAYPAHPDDAVSALTGTAVWPGPALVWVAMDRGRARFVPGR